MAYRAGHIRNVHFENINCSGENGIFLTKLATRSVQLGVTFVIDVLVVWLLYKSKVFTAAKLWPPVKYESKSKEGN